VAIAVTGNDVLWQHHLTCVTYEILSNSVCLHMQRSTRPGSAGPTTVLFFYYQGERDLTG
jgi:hypothetical protein